MSLPHAFVAARPSISLVARLPRSSSTSSTTTVAIARTPRAQLHQYTLARARPSSITIANMAPPQAKQQPQQAQTQRRKQSGSALPPGYKEDSSKGAMLRFEDSLPELPVPPLQETAKRYLKTLHPLLNDQEYAHSKKVVEEFTKPGGRGEELQKRLLARRDDPNTNNWLSAWWNTAAYLGDSGPVVPYVSYFYSHRDDRRRRDPAKRAAAITTAVLDFKKQVDAGSLEPEYMRKLPMAMSSYYWMFNACRVPARPECYPVKYNAEEHPYIVVMRKNQFFKVQQSVGGRQLNTAEFEAQFRHILDTAERGPAVGAMTSERRGEWTAMRERLLNANAGNAVALEAIEAASFIVCLDDATPITLEERAHAYWHGDGRNRWYDKPLQFIVNDNGTSGFNGEHSMMDGTPTHRLNDYIMDLIFNDKLDFSNTSVRSDLADPLPIKFVLNDAVDKDIASASAFHAATMAQHDLRVQAYQGYGKGLIKKFKCSPDAYVQLVIQLAYRKMYGRNRPTYESAATRKFKEGRTETCRTVSDESVAFCTAMCDPDVPPTRCAELFRAALKAHVNYISDASDGHGVDRHLFGLRKCVDEAKGETVPDIYNDPAYAYSSHWFISSSQLSSEYFNGYGWSQVYDDGWGIAYMINENSLQFNIVSKSLGCDRMSFFINEAASEIRDIMLRTLEPAKAKL